MAALAASAIGGRACAASVSPAPALIAIERQHGLRIGAVMQAANGRVLLSHRADERFLLCSTFKAFLVGAVLDRAEVEPGLLQRRIAMREDRRVVNSPVTARQPSGSSLTVEELCAATIEVSDNTAANCLLDLVGGPAGMTRVFRRLGDRTSRLDRLEPQLNLGAPGDLRDTTTPAAVAGALRRMLLGPRLLGTADRTRVLDWMARERNGTRRIRAGMPAGWTVCNKPGTNYQGAANDIAIVRDPTGQAFAIAVYVDSPRSDIPANEDVIAQVARIAALSAASPELRRASTSHRQTRTIRRSLIA